MRAARGTYQERVGDERVLKLAREAGVELFEADLAGLDRRSEATVVRALSVIKAGRRR